jgi:hypothetical protein
MKEFPNNPPGEFPNRRGEFPNNLPDFPNTLREFPNTQGEFPNAQREFPNAAALAVVGGCPRPPWVVPGAGVRMPVACDTGGPKEGPPTVRGVRGWT